MSNDDRITLGERIECPVCYRDVSIRLDWRARAHHCPVNQWDGDLFEHVLAAHGLLVFVGDASSTNDADERRDQDTLW